MKQQPLKTFYPYSIEKKYTSQLRVLFLLWFKNFLNEIDSNLSDLTNEASRYLKVDADWPERVRLIVNKHKGFFDTAYFRVATQKAKDVFYEQDSWSKRQQDRVDKKLGISLSKSTLWREGTANAFIHQNTALIKKLSEEVSGKVESSLFAHIQAGHTTREISKDIRQIGDFTKNRSELIARDQVSKLNGQLTRIRQKQAGISHYIWDCSEDERLCDICSERQGKRYSWDEDPRPGEIHINCRCSSLADLSSVEGLEDLKL